MKKFLVILMLLTLVTGCAFLQKASDLICAPTVEQQQTAGKMLAALDAAQAFAAGFYPVVGIFKASAILTTIQNGGCFLVAELTEAFKAVDAANAATVKAQAKMLKGAPAALPEYAPLRRLIK